MPYKSFKEMPVWKEAMSIAVDIFGLTDSFPKKEDYGLTSQLLLAGTKTHADMENWVKFLGEWG